VKKEYQEIAEALFFSTQYEKYNLKTYAIVDSVRDEIITEKILFSNLSYINLWDEDIEAQAQSVPLHLLALTKESELTHYLLENHEKSIATYFLSPYDLEELQAYYSHFTLPTIEDTKNDFKKGIFGFYDPNILPNYLKTLYNREKIDEFFAGIAVWITPLPRKKDMLHVAYRGRDTSIVSAALNLTHVDIKEKPLKLNFENIHMPDSVNLEYIATERTIDYIQVQMFRDFAKKVFLEALFSEYKSEGESFYHSEDVCMEQASILYDEAKEVHNIHSEGAIYRYILLGLIVLQPLNELSLYHTLHTLEQEWEKVTLLDEEIANIKNRLKVLNNEH